MKKLRVDGRSPDYDVEGDLFNVVIEGRYTRRDQSLAPYQLLPVQVPDGLRGIEVRYAYEKDADNVIDLGLLDPRGGGFPSAVGFRGWSGSERDQVEVAEYGATPGYLPGPIFPGTWHVLLGLYKIGEAGCRYRVQVSEIADPKSLSRPRRTSGGVARAQTNADGWYRGDLQSHTEHSDAQCTVDQLADAARARDLDFLAVTDHNTVSHHPHLPAAESEDLCLIPGMEVTTYHGHANVWGAGKWLDFRCRSDEDVLALCDAAHRQGRLFSINHPKPGGPPWMFTADVPADAMEVWQRNWQGGNEHSLALWERLLRAGRRVVAVGGSDCHPFRLPDGRLFDWLGYPTTWVRADGLSVRSVLEGIRAGHVTVSASPDAGRAVLTVRGAEGEALQGDVTRMDSGALQVRIEGAQGCVLRVLSRRGELVRQTIPAADWVFGEEVALADHGYVRVEVRMPDTHGRTPIERCPMVTMTNPVWHAPFVAP